ncbi:MAG: HAMP domain-containing histidine kinase [Myxococcota bacterium]|nr:HAMP domain-containing histidine kinase [Myxococcota bacterium]
MTSLLAALQEARAAFAAAETVGPSERAIARRLARELDEAIAPLEGRQPEKDLVSIICHDLKDPLASIVMGAGFLKKTMPRDDGASRRVLDAIVRSSDRMGQVVANFHDLAKLECGLLSIEVHSCDVTAALRGILGPLGVQAQERGVILRFEAPPEPVLALVDRARLLQIVSNLVGNAVRFTPADGTVIVRVADTGAANDANRVRIEVEDTGRGIATERLPNLFDYAANARRAPRDGPGLGLAIVRGLVEWHGGEVTVRSTLGEGSTFAILLPRASG